MWPSGIPDTHLERMVQIRHSVTWRGMIASNTFNFVAPNPVRDDDRDELVANFQAWFHTPAFVFGRPSDYLPFNISELEWVVEHIVTYSKLPIVSNHYQRLLELSETDPVVIGRGTCIMVRWTTGYTGRGQRGRSFLGPVGQRILSNQGCGLMTAEAQLGLSISWDNLVSDAGSWYSDIGPWALILLHQSPLLPADDPQGWYSYIRSGYIPDRTLRAMSRRVPSARRGLGPLSLGV